MAGTFNLGLAKETKYTQLKEMIGAKIALLAKKRVTKTVSVNIN